MLKKSLSTFILNGLVVINFSGHPKIDFKKSAVVTGQNEFVIIKINDQFEATVLQDSEISIDDKHIHIKSGQVQIKDISIMPKDEIKIETVLFSTLIKAGQKNLINFKFNLATARLDICNLGPERKINLFDHEVVQELKTNEGVSFLGEFDSKGQAAFDLLLENRKIPKGKWLDKTVCSAKDIEKIKSDIIIDNEKKQKIIKATRVKQIAMKKKNDSRFLCHKPYGNLNQCVYILNQETCTRKRCNANGDWAEAAEVSLIKNQCSKTGVVAECGY